jgi:hypothetical protein
LRPEVITMINKSKLLMLRFSSSRLRTNNPSSLSSGIFLQRSAMLTKMPLLMKRSYTKSTGSKTTKGDSTMRSSTTLC